MLAKEGQLLYQEHWDYSRYHNLGQLNILVPLTHLISQKLWELISQLEWAFKIWCKETNICCWLVQFKKYFISDIIVLSFVFICCWYRFLSYIEVFFWFHNVKFEFPKFSFSWFHRPIKDCLFLRLKTEIRWAIKDKWIKGLTCYLFKVWLFWKKIYCF